MASSALSSTSDRQASLSPASPQSLDSSSRPMQQPMIMELSSSTSTSSIDSSPFDQPSSRRLFHDTPTGSHHPQLAGLVSPTPTSYMHNGVSTPTTSADQDVFGKIDHTPLRQETYSTSPLPNSRSLQMGDMLDHVLDADQFSRLSVGNIIAPERNSSKKPPKRLPTDPGSMTASPTPASKTSARPRSTLASIAATSNNTSASSAHAFGSSPVSKHFQQRPYPPSEELSMQVKQHMAALQESPQTH
ncbi:hypothetical protein PHBOTO_000342 [Pseudozyma hubeiensis]|nr:hypothetical protein PHBOTO_000342 [Pseudozyma hubeiensis]